MQKQIFTVTIFYCQFIESNASNISKYIYSPIPVRPWHIMQKSYYAMLLCPKNNLIKLPTKDYYALKNNLYAPMEC